MANSRPVILVHGLLGFGPKEMGPFEYWKNAHKVRPRLDLHEASVGPLSSAHDRACELAAQIRGTKVDYGKKHAENAKHAQFGEDYTGKGFVPDWGPDKPVHMVGHGLGAATIRCLQHLLDDKGDDKGDDKREKLWPDWERDHTCISSVTSISGSLNGSTMVYLYGADDATGRIEGFVPTQLMRLLEIFTAATGSLFDSIYDFDLGHWGYERREGEALTDFINRVADSDFLWGEDNAIYSMSLQGAHEANKEWETNSDTYYFSYVTEQTYSGLLSGNYYPNLMMNPGLLVNATYMGRKGFDEAPIPGEFESKDWWENDGMIPAFSQKVPHTQGSEPPLGKKFDYDRAIAPDKKGEWHYCELHDVDHLDLTVWPQLFKSSMYQTFYENLFERLASLKIEVKKPKDTAVTVPT